MAPPSFSVLCRSTATGVRTRNKGFHLSETERPCMFGYGAPTSKDSLVKMVNEHGRPFFPLVEKTAGSFGSPRS